jgi:7-cyano-7-deazaguanine reductase
MSAEPHFKALGSAGTRYRYQDPELDILEVFENANRQALWVAGLDCLEFTALCPVTGQPDFGRIQIHYVPDRLCVESKSLKLYLGAYRNHGSFHEDCVNRIADDLVTKLDPWYLRVFGDFNVRGGIAIRPLALRVSERISAADRDAAERLLAHHDRLTAR